jgi:hypothetical protein
MSVTLSPTSRISNCLIYLLSDTYEYSLFILFVFFSLLNQPAFITYATDDSRYYIISGLEGGYVAVHRRSSRLSTPA